MTRSFFFDVRRGRSLRLPRMLSTTSGFSLGLIWVLCAHIVCSGVGLVWVCVDRLSGVVVVVVVDDMTSPVEPHIRAAGPAP